MKTSELKQLVEMFNKNKVTPKQSYIVLTKARHSSSVKELVTIAKYGCTLLQLFMVENKELPPVVYRAILKYARSKLVLDKIREKVPKLAYIKAEVSVNGREC